MAISEVEIRPGKEIETVTENVLNFGVTSLPCKVTIPIHVIPRKGNTDGQRLQIQPVFDDIMAGVRVLAEILPHEIVCSARPTREELILSLSGNWDKALSGALQFKPLEQSIFIVHPTQLAFEFWEAPKVLIGRYNPALDQATYDPIDWVALGPLRPGGECRERLLVKLEGQVPGSKVDIQAKTENLKLPDGVICTANADIGGILQRDTFIEIAVSASDDAEVREGAQFTGDLLLASSVPGLSFSQARIPLKVFGPKAEMVANWRSRTRSYYAKVRYNWKLIGLFVVLPVAILGLIASVGYMRYKTYMSRFVPPEGWLIVLESPTENKVENTDLKELSEDLKKDVLVVGSGADCDIRLPHKSVEKEHAIIRSGKEGTPTPVYIAPQTLSNVKVNDYILEEEIMLQDRDIVTIGAFQFLYSNSHLKQVVVHFKNGSVKQGVPFTWNIEDDGFVLRVEGRDAEQMPLHVPFRELKGVFFVKDFDREIARKMKLSVIYAKKDHIKVKFRDGETIEGYTMQKYDATSPRFFMTPKVEPGKYENNLCILVERASTKRIKVLGEST
jgi:hypothetical protein